MLDGSLISSLIHCICLVDLFSLCICITCFVIW